MQWIQNFEEKLNLSLDFHKISYEFGHCEYLKMLAEKQITGYVAKSALIELIIGAMDT